MLINNETLNILTTLKQDLFIDIEFLLRIFYKVEFLK